MALNNFLLLTILIPLAGALILPFLGRISVVLRNGFALACVFLPFVFSVIMMPAVLSGKEIVIQKSFVTGFNVIFVADGLAVFMAFFSSLISAIIVFYSFEYISHYDNQNEYYAMVSLFFGAMMGLVFSANLILLYIFWEITAIASWRLIGFFREKNHVIKADKSFLVTAAGAFLMLLGFISLYQQTGSFDLMVIKEFFKTQPLAHATTLLILVGILSKSATLPFHTWLPDAGVAPSPVTALLHAAILVKIGIYVFARLFLTALPLEQIWHTVIPYVAAGSAIVSAGAALIETDLKRIVAYSTVSQIGFIFFGLSTGNETAVFGGLLYIFIHGLAKAGLFLCCGIVEQKTKIRDVTKLGGLLKTMPVTAVSFLFCSFSVMGIPPFGGFFSKYMVFAGGLESGQIGIVVLFFIGAFMTILYLFRVFHLVFLGEPVMAVREGGFAMISSVALLAVLSLLSGIFINGLSGIVRPVLQGLTGVLR